MSNQEWPGVAEGVEAFLTERFKDWVPFAVNHKMWLCKPEYHDTYWHVVVEVLQASGVWTPEGGHRGSGPGYSPHAKWERFLSSLGTPFRVATVIEGVKSPSAFNQVHVNTLKKLLEDK